LQLDGNITANGAGSVGLYAVQKGFASEYRFSDLCSPLVRFWLNVKSNNSQLVERLLEIRSALKSAAEVKEFYDKIKVIQPKDSLSAAIIFFVQNRCSFSGSTESGGFSKSAAMDRFTVSAIERIENLESVLSDVLIAPADYRTALEVFTPHSLCGNPEDYFAFLDPPYITPETGLYGKNGDLHKKFDHEQLAAEVSKLNCKWLLTIDDCETARRLYKDFFIEEWDLQYSANKSKIGRELFVSNY